MNSASATENASLQHQPPPQGHACAQCGSPVDDGDQFCNACGAPQEMAAHPSAPATRSIECKNCGAMLKIPADQRSITCPFCDSNYVVDLPTTTSDRQPPEFVLGFAVTPEQALEKFRKWLKSGGMFRPGDLQLAKIEDKLRGVYLPFWSFSMLAQSAWSAEIGEYWYRTETYTTSENGKTVTRTRQVRETEWWPLRGRHHRYYSGFLVSGSRGLPQVQAERIKPYRLESLKRYLPYFLAGWLSEEYSVERDEALAICQQEFGLREQKNVASFMPGDTHSSLAVTIDYSDVNSDLILLPVYLLSYRYGDKLFRFLLNGQTGKAAGDRPWSRKRIGMAVAMGLAVLLVIALLYFWNR
ncbi:MAG: zinc ribbon domain-containing protein [Pirellulales bacterium]|nr:zinc ribbon domain-containing protein [Pirellulales bacterium]